MNNSVLSMLVGRKLSDNESVIDQGYSGKNQATAGCFIKTQAVYSICKGTVLSVERDPNTSAWCVTVWVNSQQWVRYCYLSAVKVVVGTEISENTPIGYAYKNLMKFEYCTATKSKFPVRVSTKQLYKHDPTPVLSGQIPLSEVIVNA